MDVNKPSRDLTVFLIALLVLAAPVACSKKSSSPSDTVAAEGERASSSPGVARQAAGQTAGQGERPVAARDAFEDERASMVEDQLVARGIRDPRVIAAMGAVPRHEFVPQGLRGRAYDDSPLPIGDGQTISQPYIVALMTELADVDQDSRVLEIGTGSGYQAAVLAEIAGEVHTIEIVEPLGQRARQILERLGHENIEFRIGDGYRGWPEAAPFDAIVVTAAPPEVPEPLKQQLAVGGRLIIPVGQRYQSLRVITRTQEGFDEREVASVLFVPMTGEAQK